VKLDEDACIMEMYMQNFLSKKFDTSEYVFVVEGATNRIKYRNLLPYMLLMRFIPSNLDEIWLSDMEG
jgi:hypothetical protein